MQKNQKRLLDSMGNAKEVILTGSNGYLGKELQKELRKKKIRFITVGKIESNLNINLLNRKESKKLNMFKNHSILINCAGFVPKKFIDYDSDKNAENVKILKNILNTKIKKIIFVSSFSVYGSSKHAKENIIVSKKYENKYLKSKIECEKISNSSKKKVIIVRIPGLFGGTKKKGLIYNYINSLIYKKRFKIKKKYPYWTSIHVKDAAKGIIELMLQKSFKSEIYNLTYKKNHSALETIKLIADKFNKKIIINDNHRFNIFKKFNFFSIKNLNYRINQEIINLKNEQFNTDKEK